MIHPGDGTYIDVLPSSTQPRLIVPTVQRVYAVGEPPQDKICFFRGLKNVVVLPAVGAYLQISCALLSTYRRLQVTVLWLHVLLEATWMGELLGDQVPRMLTIL